MMFSGTNSQTIIAVGGHIAPDHFCRHTSATKKVKVIRFGHFSWMWLGYKSPCLQELNLPPKNPTWRPEYRKWLGRLPSFINLEIHVSHVQTKFQRLHQCFRVGAPVVNTGTVRHYLI